MIELGIVIWVLIGWQFTLAEFVGGLVLIVIMTVLLRLFVSRRLEEQARANAQKADAGHQHHSAGGAHDDPSSASRASSAWSDVAHNFRNDWSMLWKEITIGFLLAGFIGQLPDSFFNALFLNDAPRRGEADRERDRRPDHRRPQLRLLGRQRPARRGPLVRRDQLRRGDRVHLRRPDRDPDRPDLPQVLRRSLHGPDRRADVRDDGHRGADRGRPASAASG